MTKVRILAVIMIAISSVNQYLNNRKVFSIKPNQDYMVVIEEDTIIFKSNEMCDIRLDYAFEWINQKFNVVVFGIL